MSYLELDEEREEKHRSIMMKRMEEERKIQKVEDERTRSEDMTAYEMGVAINQRHVFRRWKRRQRIEAFSLGFVASTFGFIVGFFIVLLGFVW